ncbi:hypothetical protein R75461_07267 [Paraburkholderia nemoris]|uniref:hypothetical protein n=1 Tax=Paraburkholderia nemoris TaxID=2793076 RepID=UPI001909FCB3|nr:MULTISPECIES: hypothetical protein [Paraburkholderia]CAE6846487.1 hypothetical protein R75461_07267 [Paraburkholderia nemoris]
MRQILARPEQSQSLQKIIHDALRGAAHASTPNGAIDVLGDALTRLAEIAHERGLQ